MWRPNCEHSVSLSASSQWATAFLFESYSSYIHHSLSLSLSHMRLTITTRSSVATKIDVAVRHYGRKPALFYFFSPYRRVDERKRTAGDKDASFCYLSHSWFNLLFSGLVPPSSRCRTTLHSPPWVTRETEVEETSSPSHVTTVTLCIWTNKMHKILVIRLYFPLDALHVSDCISPSSGATL